MADIVYKDSAHKFTDPIRYFKANDPHYWEVENIPLKQIHSNVLWLKDQVGPQTIGNIDRRDIAELKPYVSGEDNVVKVLPGRYTARVNNAYDIEPLQTLTQVLGSSLGSMDAWNAVVTEQSSVKDILNRIKSRVSANFLGLNGLVERAFTYPVRTEDLAQTDYVTVAGGPTVQTLAGINKPVFPISEALMWANRTNDPNVPYSVKALLDAPGLGFTALANMESHAIKRWRGVARTAIVDVPSELEITIPPFNSDAYFYVDDAGNEQKISGATNRIDLLFVYSKPIDVSSTYVGEYVNGAPTQLTSARLGLVHGAGLGMNFKQLDNVERSFEPQSGIDSAGKTQILANPSDQLMTDAGFTQLNVHGSFPAPDDLMNIAPLIAEDVESTSPLLVGQSILPLAYIVTTSDDTTNASGVNVLTDSSIIDIRPFFRTAELSYNERAGIAAAMPQLSLANPAVGKAQLDWEIRKTVLDYTAKIKNVSISSTTGLGQDGKVPRTVAAGYIFGGAMYGVEAAFVDYLKTKNPGATTAQAKSELVKMTSLPDNTVIPDFPQWDLSKWVQVGNYSSKGDFPNDYINTHVQRGTLNPADFGCFTNQARTAVASFFGTEPIIENKGHVCIHYVSKTIPFSKAGVGWMGDYNVDVELWNCVPLSCRSSVNVPVTAGGVGTWVDKGENEFTIYVAWVANDYSQGGVEQFSLAGDTTVLAGNNFRTPHNNREGGHFAGFAVLNEDMMTLKNSTEAFPGEPQAGVAIYPTVTFTVTGIPKTFSGHYLGVGRSQTITFV